LSVLPSPACLGVMLRRAPFRRPLERWFSQVTEREGGARLKDRVAGRTILAASRLFGQPFPAPECVPLDMAETVARWLRQAADAHGRSVLITHVSCAVRVALAARDAGFGLEDVVMWAGSEPPTPVKVGLIRASGAHWVPGYWMIEAGFLAQGCASPADDTDVHLFTDAFALIACPQPAPGNGGTVDAFYLTTLLPTAPKLMLNVEIDDFGVVEERSCGCPLDELGLGTHLRQIHSVRKLTGEGMSLLGGEALRILGGRVGPDQGHPGGQPGRGGRGRGHPRRLPRLPGRPRAGRVPRTRYMGPGRRRARPQAGASRHRAGKAAAAGVEAVAGITGPEDETPLP